jgi:PadR family transcriptional regulator, regulatory protein PadR
MMGASGIHHSMNADQFGKDLATGTYDLLVLDVLRDGPGYGYEILKHIFEQSHRTIRWHNGTLYKVLRDLERRGLVASRWQPAGRCRSRRYYRLTVRGQRAWRTRREQWQRFTQAVDALLGI